MKDYGTNDRFLTYETLHNITRSQKEYLHFFYSLRTQPNGLYVNRNIGCEYCVVVKSFQLKTFIILQGHIKAFSSPSYVLFFN